jgi:hypothetical protein
MERVDAVLRRINIGEGIALEEVLAYRAALRYGADTLVGEGHVDQGLLAVVPAKVVHLFAL